MRFALFIALAGLSLSAKRPITHEDVWTLKRVSSPAISPDGKWAVVSVLEPAYDDTKNVSDLWLVDLGTARPVRRLTNTKGTESGAAFSPDSKSLAFSAKREGDDEAQIYVLPLDGGEATRVTNLSTGASSPVWRPDGKALLFQSMIYRGADDDAANKKIIADRKARKYNARVYEAFPFRFWDRWLDDRRPHVFVQTIGEASAKDLLAGTKLAALEGFDGTRSVGDGDLEPVWTPAGDAIVFHATADRDRSAYAPSTTHLYRVSASGGEPVALTKGSDSYSNPKFRPDGKALYATQSRRGDQHLYSLSRLVRIDAAGPKVLSGVWDRSVGSFVLSADSSKVYMLAEQHGHDQLFAIGADGGAVEQISDLKEGVYSGLAAAAGKIVALWGSMVHPEDLALIDARAKSHRLLTDFNKDRIAEIDWQAPKHLWFTAKNGAKVHSLLVLPPSFDASKKYPLLLFPHGGPHNMTKDQFFVRWNYHLLTSPGYVLLMTNYTGSTGFGEEFAEAIHKDILRGPGSEIEQAADDAIARHSFIDGSRQAAAGGSYGGYLMNWFEGNSMRFKCLVNHAGLTDNMSMWGSTDGAYYWEQRNGGPVWDRKGPWVDQSPSTYAANFKTPMLITHGERDYRVPISQAFEIYKLLQRQKVPSKLIVFPDANHWVLKGEDARFHMSEVLAWLKKYL
ncbi:MAG: S9 family peptidase [Acidobacteria bacterium]|nr:S9 family peptidase [Acidobacteriota bacterium]